MRRNASSRATGALAAACHFHERKRERKRECDGDRERRARAMRCMSRCVRWHRHARAWFHHMDFPSQVIVGVALKQVTYNTLIYTYHLSKYSVPTLYHQMGSRDILDIPPKHAHFTEMKSLVS
jgi:hypothetical protein